MPATAKGHGYGHRAQCQRSYGSAAMREPVPNQYRDRGRRTRGHCGGAGDDSTQPGPDPFAEVRQLAPWTGHLQPQARGRKFTCHLPDRPHAVQPADPSGQRGR